MKSVMLLVRWLLAIILLAFGVLSGCVEKEQPANVSTEDVKKEVKEAYDATKGYTHENMQAFWEHTETRLAEYKKEIDELQINAKKLKGDAKVKAEQQLTALRQKLSKVSEKFKKLSSSSENVWEQIKSGVDEAMEDLGDAYKRVAAEFSNSCEN